jgi:outer membrane protein assembly factor BamD
MVIQNKMYLCMPMYKMWSYLLVFMVLVSCSQYQRVLKSSDMDAKMAMAVKLYEKKQYYKAMPLFEELITLYRGTQKAEQVYYYFAYTNYYLGDYESAAYDFDNFAKTFSRSEHAEECAYMHAYCYYLDSPIFSLDQTNTYKALTKLQLFTDQYPESKRMEEINRLMDELRAKLEEKDFASAKLYLDMGEYKAAVSAFNVLIKEYPGTEYKEESLFLALKASYLLAQNSVEEKKEERYKKTIVAHQTFFGNYPESRWKKEADKILAICNEKISTFALPQTNLK